ncbi:MAG: hypothetical protein ACI4RN_03170 [Oscillospiraceae bacterium]
MEFKTGDKVKIKGSSKVGEIYQKSMFNKSNNYLVKFDNITTPGGDNINYYIIHCRENELEKAQE